MQKSYVFDQENNNEFKTTMARWEATHCIPYGMAFMLNMFKMLLENYMLESLLALKKKLHHNLGLFHLEL
jgi:hypothetical protein